MADITQEDDQIIEDLLLAAEADEGFAEVLGIDETSLQYVEMTAHNLYEAGRGEDARDLAVGLAATEPDRPYPWMVIAQVASDEDDLETAAMGFSRAADLDEDDAYAHYRAGEALARLRRLENARRYLKEALALDSGGDAAWRQRATSILQLTEGIDEAAE